MQGLPKLGQAIWDAFDQEGKRVGGVELLHKGEQHALYRIRVQGSSYVLKCFLNSRNPVEPQVYSLLQKLDVPTLHCFCITSDAILMEDIGQSAAWRLAAEEDMSKSATGVAVASWYRRLHHSGYTAVADPEIDTSFLNHWVDVITQGSLKEAGKKLDLSAFSSWRLAVETADVLVARYKSLPQTLNYSDFAAENLALSRDPGQMPEAIVFDYDQFSLGTAYSDWRNVVYSLQGTAKESFIAAYGPVDDSERILDNVLSVLEGLVIAARRVRFPKWAEPLRESVVNDDLERRIRFALESF